MPMFEFKCKNCGNEFEKLVRNSRSDTSCPKCKSADTEKQFSSFAVSGFSSGGHSHSGGCSCGSCGGGNCSSCGH